MNLFCPVKIRVIYIRINFSKIIISLHYLCSLLNTNPSSPCLKPKLSVVLMLWLPAGVGPWGKRSDFTFNSEKASREFRYKPKYNEKEAMEKPSPLLNVPGKPDKCAITSGYACMLRAPSGRFQREPSFRMPASRQSRMWSCNKVPHPFVPGIWHL